MIFSKESIQKEIERLQNLLPLVENGAKGSCSCCGGPIYLHPIWEFFANMKDGDSIDIPTKVISPEVIEAAVHHVKEIRKKNNLIELYAGYWVGCMGRRDTDLYTISCSVPIKNNPGCVESLRFFVMNDDGSTLLRYEKAPTVYAEQKTTKKKFSFW